ncbi:hypothetical protein GCM10010412_100410 [Nonomuraea recticatena]|uniref:Uncharacterized protein n=1 Tax=Nonomuraea recticatena TaxID=46178 RepID=A0ABP6FW19_9ACTN
MPERSARLLHAAGSASVASDVAADARRDTSLSPGLGRHRRGAPPQHDEGLPRKSADTTRPTGRLRRAGLHAATVIVGLVCLTLLFNPFGSQQAPTSTAAQLDPQIDLGPLPFDSFAPPVPTGEVAQPRLTPLPSSSPSPPAVPAQQARRHPTAKPSIKPTRKDAPDDLNVVQPIGPSHGPFARSDTHSSSRSSATTPPPASTSVLPRPPSASLSASSIHLGTDRSGSFNVSISPGSGTWSASGNSHINVDTNGSFTVDAPQSEPGCLSASRTASGIITVSWRGTNTGSGSTTDASGTLTLTVSWTIAKDRGYWVSSPTTGGGYWSNCSPSAANPSLG